MEIIILDFCSAEIFRIKTELTDEDKILDLILEKGFRQQDIEYMIVDKFKINEVD